jgi:hypothetical protein
MPVGKTPPTTSLPAAGSTKTSVPVFSGHWQAGAALALVPQVRPVVPQWVEACQMLQPLELSVTQVRMSFPEQAFEFSVVHPVPAVVPAAGQTQAPPAQLLEPWQLEVLTTTLQAGVLLSDPQVATEPALRQNELFPLQEGSLLQLQDALGSVPLQLVSVGQTVGAEAERHPWASWMQVTRLPEALQNFPAAVQAGGAAGQAQTPLADEQVVTPAQLEVVPHSVQPLEPRTQSCEPPLAQRCVPRVQALVQAGGPLSAASVAASLLPASAPPSCG